jgi:hypothetical protein
LLSWTISFLLLKTEMLLLMNNFTNLFETFHQTKLVE